MPKIPTGHRKYEIEHLWEHHEEAMRLLLCGMRPKDVARHVGLSTQQISNMRNSQIFRDRMTVLKGARDASSVDVARQIQELAPIALERLAEVLREPKQYDEKVVIHTAQDMLDRAGHGKVSRFEGVVGHLKAEDIAQMKADAIKAGIEQGVIETVESVEVVESEDG